MLKDDAQRESCTYGLQRMSHDYFSPFHKLLCIMAAVRCGSNTKKALV